MATFAHVGGCRCNFLGGAINTIRGSDMRWQQTHGGCTARRRAHQKNFAAVHSKPTIEYTCKETSNSVGRVVPHPTHLRVQEEA